MKQTHDYAEEMSSSDRLVDTVSVDQTTNSTYSVNQVLSGAFDSRSNFQVRPESSRFAVHLPEIAAFDVGVLLRPP